MIVNGKSCTKRRSKRNFVMEGLRERSMFVLCGDKDESEGLETIIYLYNTLMVITKH